jgi:hypothetical protein
MDAASLQTAPNDHLLFFPALFSQWDAVDPTCCRAITEILNRLTLTA